jgi:colanic acid biosynthesis protein WcaH
VDSIYDPIKAVEDLAKNPQAGLPDPVFYLVGRLTPYINVDLLIQDGRYGTLLTWRDDVIVGSGWHIPGGIIRYKEYAIERVYKVAKLELNSNLNSVEGPISINEIITKEKIERAHFISLLYKCALDENSLRNILNDRSEKIRFFKKAPNDLLTQHRIYEAYIV